MKPKKIKTYVLTVSLNFPVTHARKGEPTNFPENILTGIKQHTIRANYDIWSKRIEEVNSVNAILSVRYWTGKPYCSVQSEICVFDKDSGIGVQKLGFEDNNLQDPVIFNPKNDDFLNNIELISTNDGLSFQDFKEWFKSYKLSEPMAIIHFTKFRY